MTFNVIKYITVNTDLRQKDLAEKLGVSRAQISKWKAGDSIPLDREDELRKLAGLFGDNAEWAVFAKTEKNSQAWFDYMQWMSEVSDYRSSTIQDMPNVLVPEILLTFAKVGVPLPDNAPPIEVTEEEEYEFTPFDSFIFSYMEDYGRLIRWHEVNLLSVMEDCDDACDIVMNLEYHTTSLALGYIEDKEIIAVGADPVTLNTHYKKSKQEARQEITSLCLAMMRANIPIKIDYFDFINKSPDYIEDEMYGVIFNPCSVDDLLPYGERKILALLEGLQIKIDVLLSNEDRKSLT